MRYTKTKSFRYLLGLSFYTRVLLVDLWAGVARIFSPRKEGSNKLSHLDIEPTNICNANCVFCAYQYQTGQTFREIDLAYAEKILTAFCRAGGGDVGLTPIVGDPLVSKNLEDLIRLCRSMKEIKSLGITTNAILLTAERLEGLQDAGLTDLVISMTYPDKDEYERIYRTPNYDKLLSNLRSIMQLGGLHLRISLSVRTPRLFWRSAPLFKDARALGWNVNRNMFFDDWVGMVENGLSENDLLRRPTRGKRLPCTMLQSGPHVLASQAITACGCRDLEGKSELADRNIFQPLYERGDLRAVYYENMESLRKRFLNGKPPDICSSCHHYNPDFREGSLRAAVRQTVADSNHALRFLFRA